MGRRANCSASMLFAAPQATTSANQAPLLAGCDVRHYPKSPMSSTGWDSPQIHRFRALLILSEKKIRVRVVKACASLHGFQVQTLASAQLWILELRLQG